jgi:hypothetical protein
MGERIQVTRFITAIRAAIAAFLASWRGSAVAPSVQAGDIRSVPRELAERVMVELYGVKSPKP